jgi:predicted ArsR family transcriptional regulator
MPTGTGTADAELLNLLGDSGPLAVSEIVLNLGVTRTAVRERLLRLMTDGLIDRQLFRSGRGRPSYRYILSRKARKLAGNNFADLAAVLWQQVLVIEDSDVRDCLIGKVATAMMSCSPSAGSMDTVVVRSVRIGTKRLVSLDRLHELRQYRHVK